MSEGERDRDLDFWIALKRRSSSAEVEAEVSKLRAARARREMIALTLGGALILFTCMAATLWMIGLVLLCCLCLCAITCHPSQMILHQ